MDISSDGIGSAISGPHLPQNAADGYLAKASMVELETDDLAQVSGGLIPLAVALGFVWYQADNIRSAMDGFFDGAQL